MSRRSYKQACGLAVALDLLGERWTLLVLRELLHGPKRFKDIADGLPGIGTGLLSDRLRQLDEAGVIEHAMLPPPAGSAVYRLTADGAELRPVILGLARWGIRRIDAPGAAMPATPDAVMVGLEAAFEPDKADGLDGLYEMHVAGAPFRVEVKQRRLVVRAGAADSPRATIRTDPATILQLRWGVVSLDRALADRAIVVEGDLQRAARLAVAFGLPVPAGFE